jgi:hypothetical protein
MSTERIKCIECDAMILRSTAEKNGGMCAQCVKMSEEFRIDLREHRRQLATGEIYTPNKGELASSKLTHELIPANADWKLEPDYYSDSKIGSVNEAVQLARVEEGGHVFLVSDGGFRLNLSFSREYGVCTFLVREKEYYARGADNLSAQVPEHLHVCSACPCCGVGSGWCPSRFHMQRNTAFSLFSSVAMNQLPAANWCDTGDTTLIVRGKG